MDNNYQNVSIKQLKSLRPNLFAEGLGDDLLIANFNSESDSVSSSGLLDIFGYPFRFDSYLVIFCIKGRVKMDINLNSYDIKEKSLIINTPGNIMRISEIGSHETLHFIVLALSPEFISSIRFDFLKLFNESITLLDNPCIELDDESLSLCSKYFTICKEILDSDISVKKESLAGLLSSCFYILGSIWSEKISKVRESSPAPSARAKIVFDQFIRLVTEYHTSQRNMAFYAERLCLTPKYLSMLVKKVSGRSAPDWIDSFVILEAKNLLKYSDNTIKEIVFKLHFPNQSVFYKFFKSHTGMTPSEYRNS